MKIELRDYQKEHVEAFFDLSMSYQRIMKVMPTGTGKTTVFSQIIQDLDRRNKRVLVGVHRIELVDQIHLRLLKFGVHSGIIAANKKPNKYKKIQVASIMTLSRREAPPADYVVIDECHHATASTYRHIWNLYPNAIILGVTATPVRLNGDGFGDIFDTMFKLYDMKWYIQRGYLVKPRTFAGFKTDVSDLPVNNFDYDPVAMNQLLLKSRYQTNFLESYQRFADGLKTIVFAPTRESSISLMEVYRSAGYEAEHIDALTPKTERDSKLKKFAQGKIQLLFNVDIVSEGFDVPDTEAVQLTRPTKSLSLYMQQVGRVLRPVPGKDEGIVIDSVGNWSEHQLLPGQDMDWTLDGKPERKDIRNVVFVDRERICSDTKSIEHAELKEITPHLETLIMLDKLVEMNTDSSGLLNHDMLVNNFKDYIELQGLEFNSQHDNLLKEKIGR